MKVKVLEKEEMYHLCNVVHNPPSIQNQQTENLFQAEFKMLWDKLAEALSTIGEEGDYGDYALGPCLRNFPTVIPRAPHSRIFNLSINNAEFFHDDHLRIIYQFLATDAPNYMIWIDKEFDPDWIFRMFLTTDQAQVFCTKEEELERITRMLSEF